MKKKLENLKNVACVPYIGGFLTELTFLDESPDFLDKEKKIINANKIKIMSNILRQISYFQQFSYDISPVVSVQGYFRGIQALNEKQIFELSLKAEPKETKKQTLSNKK